MEQFSRTISLVGQSAFDRVHQARVAVFGVGGVGGYVCEALVRSGIAEIDLFDRDDVSISNLNRQIIALHSTIGQDKVDAMAARLKDINPDVRVNCRKMFYLPTNADEIDLSVYDFVVDAVDTVAAKLELARRCEQGGIRFISAMGAGNKLDPSCLRIADITKTSVCPLARAMRVSCKKKRHPAHDRCLFARTNASACPADCGRERSPQGYSRQHRVCAGSNGAADCLPRRADAYGRG